MRRLKIPSDHLTALTGEVLSRGGSIRFDARGGSMWPFVREGDSLLAEPVSPGEVSVGDVVLFRTADRRLIAHRVVGHRDRGRPAWVLCADAAPGAWELVAESDVVGRVVCLWRGGRRHRLDRGTCWLAGVLWAHAYPVNRAVMLGLRTARFLIRRIRPRL